MRSSAGGIIGWMLEMEGGSVLMIEPIRLAWLLPEKAFCPVNIS